MKVMDLFSLKDEVAIVTGGHAWLGYDMACALAEAGCSIIITSRELSRAGEAAAKIAREYAVDSLGLEMDQRSHEQVKQMAEKAYNWKGHVDILINNAGGGSGKSEGNLFKRSPQDIADLIGTNLVGSLFCCREVGRFMLEKGSGKIINIVALLIVPLL